MQDRELRDQFDEWAEPLRATQAPAVAALRSRIRRRMARTAAAAGSALAVIGLIAGLLVAGSLTGGRTPRGTSRGPGPQAHGSATYTAPPGQPYVFVNSSSNFVNQGGNTPTTPAELRNAATGKVVKVLRPVGKGASFTYAAAAPGDRLFVLAQLDSDSTVSFAELRISPDGKNVTLSPVMPDQTLPAGGSVQAMAINAGATRLAIFAGDPNGFTGSLVVYNLRTGALIGRWPIADEGFATSQFVGNGDQLVVVATGVSHGRDRLVDTSTAFRPRSSLLADSRPDHASGFPGSFTQDGNLWTNTTVGDFVYGAGGHVVLLLFSSATGKQLREIPIGPASAVNGPNFCGVLWASANGGQLLTQCGSKQLQIVGGHVTSARLPWLLPSNPGGGIFAW